MSRLSPPNHVADPFAFAIAFEAEEAQRERAEKASDVRLLARVLTTIPKDDLIEWLRDNGTLEITRVAHHHHHHPLSNKTVAEPYEQNPIGLLQQMVTERSRGSEALEAAYFIGMSVPLTWSLWSSMPTSSAMGSGARLRPRASATETERGALQTLAATRAYLTPRTRLDIIIHLPYMAPLVCGTLEVVAYERDAVYERALMYQAASDTAPICRLVCRVIVPYEWKWFGSTIRYVVDDTVCFSFQHDARQWVHRDVRRHVGSATLGLADIHALPTTIRRVSQRRLHETLGDYTLYDRGISHLIASYVA